MKWTCISFDAFDRDEDPSYVIESLKTSLPKLDVSHSRYIASSFEATIGCDTSSFLKPLSAFPVTNSKRIDLWASIPPRQIFPTISPTILGIQYVVVS